MTLMDITQNQSPESHPFESISLHDMVRMVEEKVGIFKFILKKPRWVNEDKSG
jgi:hypothetical protein